jgi:hypothetical protein
MMRSDTSAEVVHACVAVTLQREEASVLVRDAQLVIDLMLRLQVCFTPVPWPAVPHLISSSSPLKLAPPCCLGSFSLVFLAEGSDQVWPHLSSCCAGELQRP